MSNPPTEAGELINNDSLFSDSVEFDRAEKPITEREANELAEDFNDPAYAAAPEQQARGGVVHLYPEDDNTAYEQESPKKAAEPEVPEEDAPFLKKRNNRMRDPEDWVPIQPFNVPGGDPVDEFGVASALKPVKASTAKRSNKAPMDFHNGEPDMEGHEEITNCFDEPGLLYRIVNKKNKTWAFYNDSTAFEIHVVCIFGLQSKIEALGNTTMHRNGKKEYEAEVTVYPGETEMFIKGFVNGFTSKLRALPLSEEYYINRSAAQAAVIDRETAVVRDVARAAGASPSDAEAVLQACLDANVPFVDLSFPPCQDSIEKGSERKFKMLPWARPKQYLRDKITTLKHHAIRRGESVEDGVFDDQVRLFRRPVAPGTVDGGELGDCWLQCATATLCENETAVINMFRHPRGADCAKAEQRIGAYRVTFNKNGLWRNVVVDSYFPVVGSKLKFAKMKSTGEGDEEFEIWPAVLQKAYAKLHGSYAAIMSGDPVHALTDLTGAPSYRFDDLFNEATISGGAALFGQLQEVTSGQRNDGDQYQVILTTPGKAPALIPGTPANERVYDFTEEPQVAQALRGTSLLPGHAYTVLQAKAFPREGIKLIQIRNPWPYTFGGEEEEGEVADWGEGSALWERHSSIARECNMAAGGRRSSSSSGRESHTRWFSWNDALRFFAGGGVVYQKRTETLHYDARVPVTFSDCRPSIIFELAVSAPVEVILMMSNVDHKSAGMPTSEDAGADENTREYPPIMLSLAMQNEKHSNKTEGKPNRASTTAIDDVFRVVLNTAADVSAPSDSKWTFLQAREIAMRVKLTPEDGPYYVIPRMMEDETTMGGGADDHEFDKVERVHFANNYARLHPDEARECASRKEVPVTLAVIGGATAEAAGLHLRTIAGSNSVFENFPKFPTSGDVAPCQTEVYFQSKAPHNGFAAEKMATDFA